MIRGRQWEAWANYLTDAAVAFLIYSGAREVALFARLGGVTSENSFLQWPAAACDGRVPVFSRRTQRAPARDPLHCVTLAGNQAELWDARGV